MSETIANRVVIDASILIRAVKPEEDGHEDCIAALKKLHQKVKVGEIEIFEPPEFLLELHSVLTREAGKINTSSMSFLTKDDQLWIKDIIFITANDVSSFIKLLTTKYSTNQIRVRGAADLVYLWLSWRVNAALLSVDSGLLSYADQFKLIRPVEFLQHYK